jgi:hypothetical protein
MLIKSSIAILLLLAALNIFAAETQKEGKASSSGSNSNGEKKQKEAPKLKSNILDFEADVIEGERVAPNLFVQMDLGAPNMDTLMFQRKNFNDFHAIDMKRKPKYRIKGK